MQLIYPKHPYATHEASTFVIGSVGAGHTLHIHGEVVPTSKRGFFAWKLPLHDGDNGFTLVERSGNVVVDQKQLRVKRPKPIGYARGYTGQLSQNWLSPQSPTILMSGESLTVTCVAPVGETITGTVEGGSSFTLFPMGEKGWVENRTPVFGKPCQLNPRIAKACSYEGTVLLPTIESGEKTVSITLSHGGNSTPLPHPVTIWAQPKLGQVVTDRAIMRTAPHTDAERLTPQRFGTHVVVTGLREGWYRIQLDTNLTTWIQEKDIQLMGSIAENLTPQSSKMPLCWRRVESVTPYRATMQLALEEPNCPVQINSFADGITVTFYGLTACCNFASPSSDLSFHPEGFIKQIQWEQVNTRTARCTFNLTRPLSGYDYQFTEKINQDGRPQRVFQLVLKVLPKTPPETFILIDPGHGGGEFGTTSPNGVREKTVNLACSEKLHEALKQQGFQTKLTRTSDRFLSLTDRSDQVLPEPQPDIVLSIHHNALPDGRDPLTEKGMCTFYYHPFSIPLAQHIQKQLVTKLNLPDYGVLHESFHMTRIHQANALLLEYGFLIHPEEAERLLDAGFQQQMAVILAEALAAFLRASG